MSWFRKERTLNEILLDQGGLDAYQPEPGGLRATTDAEEDGAQAHRWPPLQEALVTLDVPVLGGDGATFVALSGSSGSSLRRTAPRATESRASSGRSRRVGSRSARCPLRRTTRSR